jgi:glycosyltransferase involved in cell wall biosynthesis
LKQIVFIGRPERRKGLETIVQALPGILESRPQTIFRFISNPITEFDSQPVQRWILERLPENLHSRVLFGAVQRSQLPQLIAQARLAVMPSLWENFPYAVLEAMSCGLPVIASNTGGLPEIVENEVTGLLVPPQDPQALVHAIHRLLDDEILRNRLGVAARAKVEMQYSLAAVLPKMLDLYQHVARA